MELGLAGKVCIVTGSTAGIGLCVAQQLREEGALVVTAGRRAEGIGDLHVAGDLTRPGDAGHLVAAAVERFGRIDVVVNNLGGTAVRRLDELTDADWLASFELNLMTAVRVTHAALPVMIGHGGGVIVNVVVDLGEASVVQPARILRDESGAAVVLTSRRRPVREGRNPLQRGHAGADGHRRLGRRGRPRRPAG